MGYSHSWRIHPRTKKRDLDPILPTIKAVLKYFEKDVAYSCFFPEKGPPEVTSQRIRFEGNSERNSCDTFLFQTPQLIQYEEHFEDQTNLYERNNGWFGDYVKTNRLPYDDPIMTILLILKKYYGRDFKIASDGDFEDEEWSRARDLAKQFWEQTQKGSY